MSDIERDRMRLVISDPGSVLGREQGDGLVPAESVPNWQVRALLAAGFGDVKAARAEALRNYLADGAPAFAAMTAQRDGAREALQSLNDNLHDLVSERDALDAEVTRLRELARTNFDLYHEAMVDLRKARAERDVLKVDLEMMSAEHDVLVSMCVCTRDICLGADTDEPTPGFCAACAALDPELPCIATRNRPEST